MYVCMYVCMYGTVRYGTVRYGTVRMQNYSAELCSIFNYTYPCKNVSLTRNMCTKYISVKDTFLQGYV